QPDASRALCRTAAPAEHLLLSARRADRRAYAGGRDARTGDHRGGRAACRHGSLPGRQPQRPHPDQPPARRTAASPSSSGSIAERGRLATAARGAYWEARETVAGSISLTPFTFFTGRPLFFGFPGTVYARFASFQKSERFRSIRLSIITSSVKRSPP